MRNDSDGKVHIGPWLGELLHSHFWKLLHSNSEEVLKTSKGEMEFRKEPRNPLLTWVAGSTGGCIYPQLQPGQECRMGQIRLSDYFDLTKPDTYELTCYLTKFIDGQYFESPLHSNTLTFRVLEEGVPKEPSLPSDQPPDEFLDRVFGKFFKNPPQGEEVFKQSTPPKNVFYVYDKNSMPAFIDISPEMYYREKPPVE